MEQTTESASIMNRATESTSTTEKKPSWAREVLKGLNAELHSAFFLEGYEVTVQKWRASKIFLAVILLLFFVTFGQVKEAMICTIFCMMIGGVNAMSTVHKSEFNNLNFFTAIIWFGIFSVNIFNITPEKNIWMIFISLTSFFSGYYWIYVKEGEGV